MKKESTKVVRVVSSEHARDREPEPKKSGSNFGRHFVGVLLLLPLLIFHFLCFIVTLSMGIGVGILASVLHEICFDTHFYAFWQTYVTLVTLFIVIELFFRVGFDTTLTNWMNRQQEKHRIELYYIPRGLYLTGYCVAVCLLYYAYYGSHTTLPAPQAPANGTLNKNSTTTPAPVPPTTPGSNSTFDGEGDSVNQWKTNPLSLSPSADHFHYSLIFFISISYMMYVMCKENDFITHRRTVMSGSESQPKQPDPVRFGGVGNFVLFLGAHIILTIIYGLPLIGAVFLARQFLLGPILTYITGVFMAVLVGLGALFIERRRPFPTRKMTPPAFAYENHLRIRLTLFQLWLLPFAAGRYFDGNRESEIDAQNDDFIAFVVEVGIGVVQAIKIFGNDIFLLKVIYFPPKNAEANTDTDEEYDFAFPGTNEGSIISIAQSTQTMYDGSGDDEPKSGPVKPEEKPQATRAEDEPKMIMAPPYQVQEPESSTSVEALPDTQSGTDPTPDDVKDSESDEGFHDPNPDHLPQDPSTDNFS